MAIAVELQIVIRHLLLDCKEAGIDVEVQDEQLVARGAANRTDLYSDLKKHKDTIVDAMVNLHPAIESHYVTRLRRGMELMEECLELLRDNPDNEKVHMGLVKYMCKWAELEEEMRRIYPEYRGCPMDGCKGNDVPVKCQECADEQ